MTLDYATAPRRDGLSLWISWGVILGIVGFILVRNTRAYLALAKQPLTAVVPAPNPQLEILGRMIIGEANLLAKTANGSAAVNQQKGKMVAKIDEAAVSPA